MNLTLHVWRQKNARRQGALRHLRGEERQPRHVVPRDARRGQRGAHREGRGPDRLRPRLPRGHLRHLQHGDQRQAPRAAASAPPPASSTCGHFKDGDTHRHRALARQGLPGGQGPGRGPQRLRPHHRRPAASSPCPPAARPTATPSPCPKENADLRHGRRRLHRLRRLRRRLPQRLGHALRRGQGRRTWRSCPRASPSATTACAGWSRRWTTRASATAPTTASARPPAPRASSSTNIARMNRDFLKASLMGAEESKGGGGAG